MIFFAVNGFNFNCYGHSQTMIKAPVSLLLINPYKQIFH